MIINVFSTPRTGSNHYTEFIKNELESYGKICVVATEPFNSYRLGMYHKNDNGRFRNYNEYQDGSYWIKPIFDLDKNIFTEKVFLERTISVEELSNLWLRAHEKLEYSSIVLISHNHVIPCIQDIKKLSSLGYLNYFCKRRDILEQISSYVIAYYTKVFANFGSDKISSKYTDSIIDVNVLNTLISRIYKSNLIINELSEVQEVYYEDMNFENSKFKRYTTGKTFDLLCEYDKSLIRERLNHYENNCSL